jgi:hypothetical protein
VEITAGQLGAAAFDASDEEQLPDGRDLVTVERFTEVWEAHILRARLEAEGLLASIADEHLVAMDWFYSNAIGGVRVQVPACELDRAREILTALQRGDYELHDDADTAADESAINSGTCN